MASETLPRTGGAGSSFAQVPPPSSRADVGQSRLEARDRWNASEIALQQIFAQSDLDQSGFLEEEELRDMLCKLGGGDEPNDEQYEFVMRNADKNGDGKIDITEIDYCLRVCDSYQRLLRHFAEFDTGGLESLESLEPRVRTLLIEINDGKPVPPLEVEHIVRQASEGGTMDRAALLGAVAAWYLHVDRKGMDMPSLIQEAMTRTLSSEGESALAKGHRSVASAVSHLRGGQVGYEPVEDGPGELPNSTHADSPSVPAERRKMTVRRLRLVGAHCATACGAYGYIICPLLSNVTLIFTGVRLWSSECPHNLGGILACWGAIGLLLSFLISFERPRGGRASIGAGVVLVALMLVGGLWTWSDAVQEHKQLCGHSLVNWSQFVWSAIPVAFLATIVHFIAVHVRKLRKNDVQIQRVRGQSAV